MQSNSIAETPYINLDDKNNTISSNFKNNVDNIKNSNSKNYKIKRTYNEMIKSYETTQTNDKEQNLKEGENKIIKKKFKKRMKKNYERLIKNTKEHYYFIDEKGLEWQFTEINGSTENYYFQCSFSQCNGFVMIKRQNKDKKFILTKLHNKEY